MIISKLDEFIKDFSNGTIQNYRYWGIPEKNEEHNFNLFRHVWGKLLRIKNINRRVTHYNLLMSKLSNIAV
jgi:hypothetical protein